MPASEATARVCRMVFVEPPMAISSARALSRDFLFMISSGLISFSRSSRICFPAVLYSFSLFGSTARMVPFPGSAIPIASQRQFIEFAVNIPEQLPCVGQPVHSSSVSFSSLILPELNSATPSKMLMRSTALPSFVFSAFMGPPETKMVGMFSLTVAISIPGMILSQFGMQMRASKQCALTIVSTESAIISLEGREYFMPACPIAMPSHTAIVLNSKGVAPAFLTAFFTVCATLSRWTCPGTISQKLLAIPINGLSKS